MAPPKAKVQKMSLGDFLFDESTGSSWADEVATLPTAPAPRGENAEDDRRRGFGSRGDRQGGYERESRGDRYDTREPMRSPNSERFDREPRAPVPLPTQPPFTAHIGNLPFDVNEDDLAEFFGEMKIASIRVLKDRDEKPKGFGYIEFEDLDSLKAALVLNGESLKSRPMRVNVADPPREREVREDRTAGNSWRRDTPLQPSGGGGGPRDRFGDRNDRGGFGDRGERGGFGDRGERGGFGDRGDRGGFRDRYTERPERAERGERQRDTSWSGGAFQNRPNRDDRPPREGGFGEKGDWGDRRGGSYGGTRDPPAERPRLALQPRTGTTPLSSPSLETPRGSKTDPFGAAKPVDAEEAWKRTKERKRQREAAKKPEDQPKSDDGLADAQSQEKDE